MVCLIHTQKKSGVKKPARKVSKDWHGLFSPGNGGFCFLKTSTIYSKIACFCSYTLVGNDMSDGRFHKKKSAQFRVFIHIRFSQRRWDTNITCVRLSPDDYSSVENLWHDKYWWVNTRKPPSLMHTTCIQQLHLRWERKTGIILASVFKCLCSSGFSSLEKHYFKWITLILSQQRAGLEDKTHCCISGSHCRWNSDHYAEYHATLCLLLYVVTTDDSTVLSTKVFILTNHKKGFA